MGTLTVGLTAALVDNPATPSARTKVEVALSNSSGRLSVENCEGSPRSVHRFTVKDAIDVGVGSVYGLTANQAGLILATSCSITNPRILFSPLQHNELPVLLKKSSKVPSKAEVVDTPTGKIAIISEIVVTTDDVSTLLMTKVCLDEVKVLDVVNRQLVFSVFSKTSKSDLQLNILLSLKSYREALRVADGLSCYQSLFNALELAVNAGKEVKGRAFDLEASNLTAIALTPTEIEEIRRFNDRVKHVLRRRGDFATLEAGEARMAQLALNLKKAADCAILSRI